MTEIPLRELRNDTSGVLRRVEDGERFTVTVSGRPVAQLIPLPRRKRYLTWEELTAVQADPGLYGELREMLPDTTDDIGRHCRRAAAGRAVRSGPRHRRHQASHADHRARG